jgi:hypothetical protein
MLAEVISFGGRYKDFKAIVRSRIRQDANRTGEKNVRLKAESDEKTVLVKILVKQRDGAQTIDEIDEATGKKTGKKVENPRYGKFFYETAHTIELEQTTHQEVKEAVLRGISLATKK